MDTITNLKGETGRDARRRIRAGSFRLPTSGMAPGYVQGNLAILPQALAADFARFCQLNPKPCPVLGQSEPGDWRLPHLGEDLDIRTDIPLYRVWQNGELIEEVTDLKKVWRDDLVSFVLGCSFSFEAALIENGHLFLAVPPLYKLTHGAKSFYARDDRHKDEIVKREFKAGQKIEVSRFKGLGEMNASQLKETTMDPKRRTLLRVEIGDGDRSAISEAINALMGSKPEARFRFIQDRAAFAKDLDI